MKRTGQCLCGAVRVSADVSAEVGACQWTFCRRWGGPLLAVESHGEVDFAGAEHIGVFGSSDWAERGFCKRCGSHLFYRLKEGGLHALPVGLFGDGERWEFAQEIFIDEKPAFYDFANDTEKRTGAEVFAQFQSQD
jgi:hypothetical protein